MNGRHLAKLVGAALLAATVFLGGCVAETGDEEQDGPVAQTGAADGFVPLIPKKPGGIRVDPTTDALPAISNPPAADPSVPPEEDPDPNPWFPPVHAH